MHLFHTTLFSALLTLLVPIMLRTTQCLTAVKLAFMISLAPLTIFVNSGMQTTTISLVWVSAEFNTPIGLLIDYYTVIFIPVALFITWAILEFTTWYMATDPHQNKFTLYLLLFLLAMLLLISANNMLQLFIGWEGVGIMSFLLIGWWHARVYATTSALQAVIYNRLGDIGLILALAWFATHLNTWDIQQLLPYNIQTAPLIGLILAAMAKSAQFGLHPWLPAAMEGPTPVSALLHSSTMVVAGIFLLIRLHPMLLTNPFAPPTCLCLGATTMTFAALCALTQNDIKKIIAFSTSSQLGLMMFTLGLNQPNLAFLHIITHAFFKAMLFLCAGSIIHALQDEQDIRKMGSMQKPMPITTTALTIGNLALMGTPFLAGFYTKDLILETMNMSNLNAWALTTALVATALTAAYTLRLTYYVQLSTPRHHPTSQPTEDSPHQTRPLLRLSMGSVMTGLLITHSLLPQTPPPMTMPTTLKLSALLATLIGLTAALDLARHTTTLISPQPASIYTMTTQLGFFNTLVHRTSPNSSLQFAQTTALHLNDLLWYETMIPKNTQTMSTLMTNKLTNLQTGMIKTYLSTFIVLTALCLTTLL
uniref:NADH-ubiquinone oxidoreductase chain 5 n=1 Tax=Gonatodes albogularis TaxID=460622 RepID=A0A1Y1CC42_GONAL|nr:NADH dehydrogenase subunit 5 [Gonatodes albogularis]BAX77894.1 NADH dehydrogenase subunit 5 [Gonatodes albogularis]